MSSPDAIARQIARQGREVTLMLAPSTQGGAWRDFPVIAHVIDSNAAPLAPGAGVQQVERMVRVAQAEMDRQAVPRALTQGDRITIDGRTGTVPQQAEIRLARGLPVLHLIRVRGA